MIICLVKFVKRSFAIRKLTEMEKAQDATKEWQNKGCKKIRKKSAYQQ